MKRKKLVTVICRSCLTGKAVWVYQGPSENAARIAYYRACRKEVERVRSWGKIVAQRCQNISRLLSNCMAELPINAELTPVQLAAARRLKEMSKQECPCYREFYDHILEESRRKNEASSRWRENRQKWLGKKNL